MRAGEERAGEDIRCTPLTTASLSPVCGSTATKELDIFFFFLFLPFSLFFLLKSTGGSSQGLAPSDPRSGPLETTFKTCEAKFTAARTSPAAAHAGLDVDAPFASEDGIAVSDVAHAATHLGAKSEAAAPARSAGDVTHKHVLSWNSEIEPGIGM